MTATLLRTATPADAAELAGIVAEGFATYASFAPEGWSAPGLDGETERLARLLAPASSYRAWVAEDGARALGFAGYLPAADTGPHAVGDPRLAHVRHVFLRTQAWGRGVATALLTRLADDATRADFTAMRLYCAAGQARARAFYEREGWAPVGDVIEDTPLGLPIVEYRVTLRP